MLVMVEYIFTYKMVNKTEISDSARVDTALKMLFVADNTIADGNLKI